MPPSVPTITLKSLEQVALSQVVYTPDAFSFIQRGLAYTADQIHGPFNGQNPNRHVTGRQLCLGLREYAWRQWGTLAPVVLRGWGIRSTLDFGRIVFALIEAGVFTREPHDKLEDFRDVYDINQAFTEAA
jgi:uncharacterized repeat protein (TIGR04138 family)